MARLADPELVTNVDEKASRSAQRVANALIPNAFWMSGDGRSEVELQTRITEPLISKIGAEGVYMASIPNRGVGIALKARDGARRAADIAMEAVLEHLSAITPSATVRNLTNAQGNVVGGMNVSWT